MNTVPAKPKQIPYRPKANYPAAITNPDGRLSLIKYINSIYIQRKNNNIISIELDDYQYACTVLRVMMERGNRKERVDTAKQVHSKGKPQQGISVNIMLHGDLGDLSNLQELYKQIRDNKLIEDKEKGKDIIDL